MLPAPLGRSGDSPRFARVGHLRGFVMLLAGLSALALAACGGGARQDAKEPEGKFPVQITKSEFPNRQRLAETSALELGVKNTGDETIPDLAITISTDPNANESFSVRSEQAGLADASRSVWILENGYPKYAGETAPAGADAAQTKTFAFGPLEPGATKNIIWSVTPVIAGTYTVDYRIAAGLEGKAVAVTNDGSVPEGEFVVQISDVPPQTRVDDSGKVVPIKPSDIIGQAGSAEQRGEVGAGTGTTTTPK
jgi:hypothetical protein